MTKWCSDLETQQDEARDRIESLEVQLKEAQIISERTKELNERVIELRKSKYEKHNNNNINYG